MTPSSFKKRRKSRPIAETRAMKAYREPHLVCEACRMTAPTETHHIVTEKTGGPAEDWNLLALCYGCHQHGFHAQGWATFCAAWPHLAGKITAARIAMGRKT
jgi:5-methylcytosine-specific restriction endonuclease McrA